MLFSLKNPKLTPHKQELESTEFTQTSFHYNIIWFNFLRHVILKDVGSEINPRSDGSTNVLRSRHQPVHNEPSVRGDAARRTHDATTGTTRRTTVCCVPRTTLQVDIPASMQ